MFSFMEVFWPPSGAESWISEFREMIVCVRSGRVSVTFESGPVLNQVPGSKDCPSVARDQELWSLETSTTPTDLIIWKSDALAFIGIDANKTKASNQASRRLWIFCEAKTNPEYGQKTASQKSAMWPKFCYNTNHSMLTKVYQNKQIDWTTELLCWLRFIFKNERGNIFYLVYDSCSHKLREFIS